MSWGAAFLALVIGLLYFGTFGVALLWLFYKGTEPSRPKWQAALVGFGLLAWFLGGIIVLTKLTVDGVI